MAAHENCLYFAQVVEGLKSYGFNAVKVYGVLSDEVTLALSHTDIQVTQHVHVTHNNQHHHQHFLFALRVQIIEPHCCIFTYIGNVERGVYFYK